ncbi:hypothetical protein COT30_04200 [Candidatus Micrarchaeota archaeon CG08_land_8_20_14_0_20_49_17]|nr:MAG: hypothetical protein AUJ13_04900 [Candidatus Micrarchaeota archaeon CG1_02_49_24]PIU09479.1 MAG: hypothetical protein COT30_04200 [Candidatus Micrarchaeota archaeon CG08_land_8_20_14_0_20_49_17]PIU81683.1 MAG: hypothetical protein COS70_02750 [Candidatus Micrarchaeota archaeon CG06_land_8_20_14_3_00_50_6]PIZ92353.1 MAG: hypothetical protein COX84_06905 [Candidatus Micrarchaeota archaeon CG_4_10_14_0_2_um_filter_49_7]HII53648.1 hypothetical protein [Candidatus Micrarchaeota archaeon]
MEEPPKRVVFIAIAMRSILTIIIAACLGTLILTTDTWTVGAAIAIFAIAFISRDILLVYELSPKFKV